MWGLGISICFTLLAIFALGWWGASRRVNALERRISDGVSEFLVTPADGGPSPLAQLVQVAARAMSQEMVAGIKGSFMGQSSSIAKAETALQMDMMMDQIETKNPLVGLLLSNFPRVAKRLAKSPAAQIALSQMDLGGLLGKMAGGSGPDGGHGSAAAGRTWER